MQPWVGVCAHFFFFNDTATTEIYTLSLHDALPICPVERTLTASLTPKGFLSFIYLSDVEVTDPDLVGGNAIRSEEHTSELQSRQYLVCRLLLEKKNHHNSLYYHHRIFYYELNI